jgi:hypothetical protein
MKGRADASEAWVSASEIATYAYCPESWRLAHGLGLESRHAALRQQGIEERAAWQGVARTSSLLLWLGVALMLLALAGFLLLRVG